MNFIADTPRNQGQLYNNYVKGLKPPHKKTLTNENISYHSTSKISSRYASQLSEESIISQQENAEHSDSKSNRKLKTQSSLTESELQPNDSLHSKNSAHNRPTLQNQQTQTETSFESMECMTNQLNFYKTHLERICNLYNHPMPKHKNQLEIPDDQDIKTNLVEPSPKTDLRFFQTQHLMLTPTQCQDQVETEFDDEKNSTIKTNKVPEISLSETKVNSPSEKTQQLNQENLLNSQTKEFSLMMVGGVQSARGQQELQQQSIQMNLIESESETSLTENSEQKPKQLVENELDLLKKQLEFFVQEENLILSKLNAQYGTSSLLQSVEKLNESQAQFVEQLNSISNQHNNDADDFTDRPVDSGTNQNLIDTGNFKFSLILEEDVEESENNIQVKHQLSHKTYISAGVQPTYSIVGFDLGNQQLMRTQDLTNNRNRSEIETPLQESMHLEKLLTQIDQKSLVLNSVCEQLQQQVDTEDAKELTGELVQLNQSMRAQIQEQIQMVAGQGLSRQLFQTNQSQYDTLGSNKQNLNEISFQVAIAPSMIASKVGLEQDDFEKLKKSIKMGESLPIYIFDSPRKVDKKPSSSTDSMRASNTIGAQKIRASQQMTHTVVVEPEVIHQQVFRQSEGSKSILSLHSQDLNNKHQQSIGQISIEQHLETQPPTPYQRYTRNTLSSAVSQAILPSPTIIDQPKQPNKKTQSIVSKVLHKKSNITQKLIDSAPVVSARQQRVVTSQQKTRNNKLSNILQPQNLNQMDLQVKSIQDHFKGPIKNVRSNKACLIDNQQQYCFGTRKASRSDLAVSSIKQVPVSVLEVKNPFTQIHNVIGQKGPKLQQVQSYGHPSNPPIRALSRQQQRVSPLPVPHEMESVQTTPNHSRNKAKSIFVGNFQSHTPLSESRHTQSQCSIQSAAQSINKLHLNQSQENQARPGSQLMVSMSAANLAEVRRVSLQQKYSGCRAMPGGIIIRQ